MTDVHVRRANRDDAQNKPIPTIWNQEFCNLGSNRKSLARIGGRLSQAELAGRGSEAYPVRLPESEDQAEHAGHVEAEAWPVTE